MSLVIPYRMTQKVRSGECPSNRKALREWVQADVTKVGRSVGRFYWTSAPHVKKYNPASIPVDKKSARND